MKNYKSVSRRLEAEKKNFRRKMDPFMSMMLETPREQKATPVQEKPSRREDTRRTSERRAGDVQIIINNYNQRGTTQAQRAPEHNQGQSNQTKASRSNTARRGESAQPSRSVLIAKDNYAKEQTVMEDAIGIDGEIYSIDAAIEHAKGMPNTREKTELLRTIKSVLERREEKTTQEIEEIMASLDKENERESGK